MFSTGTAPIPGQVSYIPQPAQAYPMYTTPGRSNQMPQHYTAQTPQQAPYGSQTQPLPPAYEPQPQPNTSNPTFSHNPDSQTQLKTGN